MNDYDCTSDVIEHKSRVEHWMRDIVNQLLGRSKAHDDSKLKPPEKELFDRWTPELKQRTFGTDYYKQALDAMGDGVQHHYKANRHHPEHFENGVSGMTLVDLIEMFCDWVAAAEARMSFVDLDHAQERFDISPQLIEILTNTLRDLDFWNEVNGVPVGYFTPPDRRGQPTGASLDNE
jgi:hypothetical protein